MKKLIASLSVLASVCAFGDIDGTTVTFSTKGPDTYADGTTVLDGERYALVWSADTFDGFNADGTLVDSNDAVLMIVSAAKNGRCPLYACELSSRQVMKGGVISLWMLDTRVFTADADDATKVTASFAEMKSTTQVANVASAKQASNVTMTTSGAPSMYGSKTDTEDAGVAAAIPGTAKTPVITKMEIKDGLVYITVENTDSYIAYDVKSGDKPNELEGGKAKNPVTGGADTITLVTEQKEGTAFYSVGNK